MQFSTILLIAFCPVASVLSGAMELPKKYHGGAGARPATKTKSPQVKANVSAQIDKWLRDIESVSSFVDTFSSIANPKIISSMAATAFAAAQNEGASNAVLQQDVKLDASGRAAAQGMCAISEEGEVQAAAASAVSITVPHRRTPPACTAAAAATSCE